MENIDLNIIEITRKDNKTSIKINGQPINFIGKYSITQDVNIKSGIPYLEIKMAIDEKNSTITI